MAIIRPRGSLKRPQGGVDQSLLIEHRKSIAGIERRAFLRGSVSLGALTLLTGCDISNEGALQSVLRAMSSWNDRAQAWLFDPNKLAPTYSDADVLNPPRFNAFYGVDEVKKVDGATWRLELAGAIENKRPWTKEALYALPRRRRLRGTSASKAGTISASGPACPCARFLTESTPTKTRNMSDSSAPTLIGAASTWRPRCIRKPFLRRITRASPSAILTAFRAPQDAAEARLQAAQMDLRHGGDERLPRRLLGRRRL